MENNFYVFFEYTLSLGVRNFFPFTLGVIAKKFTITILIIACYYFMGKSTEKILDERTK